VRRTFEVRRTYSCGGLIGLPQCDYFVFLTRAERGNFYSAKYGAVSGAYPSGQNAPLAGYCT
jgi:hypothetical protein